MHNYSPPRRFFGYGRWRDWWIRADKRHALAAKYDKNAVGFIFYKFWKTIPKAYPSCRQSHIHIGWVVKKVSKLKSLKTWRKILCRNSEKEISHATSSFGVILKILSNELWCNFDPFLLSKLSLSPHLRASALVLKPPRTLLAPSIRSLFPKKSPNSACNSPSFGCRDIRFYTHRSPFARHLQRQSCAPSQICELAKARNKAVR